MSLQFIRLIILIYWLMILAIFYNFIAVHKVDNFSLVGYHVRYFHINYAATMKDTTDISYIFH